MQRRVNIQTYTANFTTWDTGIATAGNSNATFNAHDAGTQNAIAAETGVYYISNIILHIEAYQFKTVDYYNVMKRLIEAGKCRYHFKKYVLYSAAASPYTFNNSKFFIR